MDETIVFRRPKNKALNRHYYLFIIQPFVAFLSAFKHYRSSNSRNIVWLFIIYFGFTFIISSSGLDSYRYNEEFIELSNQKLNWEGFIKLLYNPETKYLDIVQPFITYLISRFSADSRILFAAFGLVFGFFYSRNIWFLFDRSGPKLHMESLIFLLTFTVVIGFWLINGFRMWTAAHVFFFGVVNYFFENKKSGILIALTSILFHFSFMFPVSLFLFFIILPKSINVYFWFMIISFFTSQFDLQVVNDLLTKILPDVFHQRVESFTNSEFINIINENLKTRNWRFHFYSESIKWTTLALFSIVYFYKDKWLNNHHKLFTLFCFFVIFIWICQSCKQYSIKLALLLGIIPVFICSVVSLLAKC